MPRSKRPARLVVDANPIRAALLGGQARRIFFESAIREFAVPEPVLREVQGHPSDIALRLDTRVGFLEYALNLLPLTVGVGDAASYGK